MASVRRDESGLFGGGIRGTGVVALAAALTAVSLVESAYAGKNVQVEHVARGTARFDRDGSVLTIRAADRTIINYRRFDVGRNETVRFVQPSATSRVLNRIRSTEPSKIDGTLTANGIVYFVNPAGVMFGHNAVINVGGLYAAAGTITDANFLNNINQFKATGAVVNQGVINGDAVALIGRTVANAGTIAAEGGLVTMVAGDDVLIGTRDGHIMVKVGSTDDANANAADSSTKGSVTNTGTIRTGTMALAGGDMYALAIGGAIRAKTVTAQAGGDVAVTGTIDASDHSPGATGGSVLVTGKNVNLTGATLDASGDAGGGSVRVGGDFQGKGDTPRATSTAIDNSTTLTASATGNGDGGKVVVWSDDKTTYNGSIYARGGPAGGDGGQVEVSGKGHLDFNGHVDTTAPKGATGSLLLDPANIAIESSNPNLNGDGTPGDDATGDITSGQYAGLDSVITAGQLVTLLNTTDISLAATNDINVNAAVDASGNAGSHALTLDAGRDINANAQIALNNATLTLSAGNRVNLTGGGIDTHGGDVSISAGADVIEPLGTIAANHLTVEAATGVGTSLQPLSVTLTGGLEAHAAAGGIFVSATGPIDLGFAGGTKGGVIADAGSVSVTGDNTIYVRNSGHVVSAASGDVSLTAAGGDVVTDNFNQTGSGQVVAGGQVTLQASGSVTIGSSTFGDVHAGTGLSMVATSGSVMVDNASTVATDAGNATLTAGATVTLAQSSAPGAQVVNNGTGTLTVTAPSFVSNSGGVPASLQAGGDVTIQADSVDVTDAIASTSGAVVFRPLTSGLAISLADAPVGGQLTLTGAQLARVSAATEVQVGDATAGDISLAGTITQPIGWNTLHLITAGAVSDAGGTLQATGLAIEAGTGIGAAAQPLNTLVSNLEAATDTGGIFLSNTGDLAIGGVSAALGGVQVATSGAIQLVNTGSITATGSDASIHTTAGNVSVTANGAAADVAMSGAADVSSLAGTVAIAAGHDVLIDNGASASGSGDVTVTAANSIQLLQSLTSGAFIQSNAGAVTLDAPSFASASGGTPASVQADGTVTIQADTVDFTDAITSTSGSVVFRPFTAGLGISLADAPVTGQLTLTDAQLARVSAATEVQVGDATAGNISIAGTITQPVGWDTLHLITGGAVSDAGGTVQIAKLAIEAVTGIGAAAQPINTLVSKLEAQTNDGGIYLSNTGDLSIGGVSAALNGVQVATTGDVRLVNAGSITATGSDASVRSSNGNLTMTANGATADVLIDNGGNASGNSDITITAGRSIQLLQTLTSGAYINSNTGAITLDAPSFVSNSGGVPATIQSGGIVTIQADTVDFTDAITSTSGSVVFRPHTAGLAISLADAPVAGQLTLTDAQLSLVTAANSVIIGDATAGDISLAGTITQPLGWNTLHLITGGAVSDAGGTVQIAKLAIGAGTGIGAAAQPINTLVSNFEAATDTGGVFLSNTGDLAIGGVDASLSGVRVATSGAIQLTSAGSVTVATSGETVLAPGNVTLTATGAAADVITGGSNAIPNAAIDSTGGTVTIAAGRDVAIGLADGGDVHAAAGLSLTAARDVTVDNGSFVETDGGDVTVDAGNSIQFLQQPSANQAHLWNNAASGAITLRAPSFVSNSGGVPATIQSGGTVTIQADAVDFTDAITSTSGSVVFRPLTSGLAISLADAPVGGQLTLTGAQLALVTAGNAVVIGDATAGDISLAGTITQPLGWDTLHLITAGSVSDADGGTLQAANLAVEAATGITLSTQSHFVGTFAASNATSGGVSLTGALPLTVGSVDGVNGIAGDGGGDVTLTVASTGDLTVAQPVTTSGGNFTATATDGAFLATAPNGTINTAGPNPGDSAGDITITATGAANVAANLTAAGSSSATGDGGDGGDVTVTGSSVSLAGVVTSGGNSSFATGAGGAAGDVTVNAASIALGGNITAAAGSGDAAGTAGDAAFHAPVTLANTVTVTAGNTTFDSTVRSTTDGAQGLTVSGSAVTFAGAIGDGGKSLASLAVTGGASAFLNGASVTTAGNQTYSGPLTLGTTVAIHTAAVTFGSTVRAATSGAQALVITNTGLATFGGAVGDNSQALATLAVSGPAALNGPSVTTTGAQAYNGAVTIGANTTLSGTTITFASTLAGGSGGPWDLTLHNTGLATFAAAVGTAAAPLQDLSVAGPLSLNGGSVTTTDNQTYSSPVTLGADTALSGAAISFNSTLDAATNGGQSLTVANTGLLTFDAAVGGAHNLSSLTVAGSSNLNGAAVTTTGDQRYRSDVTLARDTTLTAANVTFDSTVAGTTNGGESLAILNTGTATFKNNVGTSALRLESLSVAGATSIAAAAPASFFTAGPQHYAGPFNAQSDLTLTASSVTFDAAVHGAALTVNGPTFLNGSTITTTGAQAYHGQLTLHAATTTLTAGGAMTFASGVDGTSDAGQSLAVNNVGLATFGDSVGGSARLLSLSVSGPAKFVGGSQVRTLRDQTYSGYVEIHGGASPFTFHAGAYDGDTLASSGKIVFAKNLKTSGDVVLYGTGGLKFQGQITGTDPTVDTLTLQVPWVDGSRPFPIVEFAAVSGPTRVRSLSRLALQNPMGDRGVPRYATIGVTSPGGLDLQVNAAFAMDRNQKMTATRADAPITILVSHGTASLGDLSAPGDIHVTADTIELMARDPGYVVRNLDGLTLTTRDFGLDFVSGGSLTFDGTPSVNPHGNGKIAFSSLNDTPSKAFLDGLDGELVLHLPDAIVPARLTSPAGTILDLAPDGTSAANPATVRAAVAHLQDVEPDVELALTSSARAVLDDIGVRIRDLTHSEILDGLQGRQMYVQGDEASLSVAFPRLDDRAVDRAMNDYESLFMARDDSAHRVSAAKASIRDILTQAEADYRHAHPKDAAGAAIDPIAFRHFVETTPDQKRALQCLNDLRSFLTQLDLLALTDKELGDARNKVCGDVKPADMPLATFLTTVMGTPPATTLGGPGH